MPCPQSAQRKDGSFDAWLEQRLCAERSIIVEQLQEQINRRMEAHRTALISELSVSLGDAFAKDLSPSSLKNYTKHIRARTGDAAEADISPASAMGFGKPSPDLIPPSKQKEHALTLPIPSRKEEEDALISTVDGSNAVGQSNGGDDDDDDHKGVKNSEPAQTQKKKLAPLPSKHPTPHSQPQHEEEKEHLSTLQHFVRHPAFEFASMGAIMVNTLQLAVEIQYSGIQTGYLLNVDGYTQPASSAWPGAADMFKTMSYVFTGTFVLELFLRLADLKLAAVRSKWVWLDTILVALGALELMDISLMPGVNPTMMRLLRLARLARLLRMMSGSSAFDSLFLLIRSLQASFNALMWSFLLLGSLQTTVGMALAQYFIEIMRRGSQDLESRQQLFEYFGSFTKTMVTMFEISIGNWVPSCRFLLKFSEWFGAFYILYRCMLCFAVVSVIGAVFIAETGRIAASDDNVQMLRKQRQQQNYSRRVHQLFQTLDLNSDGKVSWPEFEIISCDPNMKNYLATFEIDVVDLERLFKILDDGDGSIDVEEFVNGMTSVQGFAKSFDLIVLSKLVRKVDRKLTELSGSLQLPK